MNIPEEAIDAAMEAILKHGGTPGYVAKRFAKDALEAALPHLRAEIANDIRADWRLVGPLMAGQPQSAVIEFAARTAEKGPTK